MKIAVYAISKNEAHHVERWHDSVKDADGIYVLDTGSTDATVSMLEDLGVHVNFTNMAKEFRFDDARNESLFYVPQDYDVCVSIDFDEVLQPDWRQVIESQFTANAANYTLVFDYDEHGNIVTSYPRLAIHRRNGFAWEYPVHEVLKGQGTTQDLPIACVHAPSAPKEPGHYLPLLQTAVRERPDDARANQYLAREFYYLKNYTQAIYYYTKHLELESYAPFRAETYIILGNIQLSLDNLNLAEAYYWRAVSEYPNLREPFCALATFYYKSDQYETAIGILRRALAVNKPSINFVFHDSFYTYWCHHMLMACYYNSGNVDKAKVCMEEAMRACPNGDLPQDLLRDVMAFTNREANVETTTGDETSPSITG